MKPMFVVAALLGVIAGPATAQAAAEAPRVVITGMDRARAGEIEAAIHVWAAGWDGPADGGKVDQLIEGFRPIREIAGKAAGYDILGVETVSPHLKRVYALMRYQYLPAYFSFTVYDRGERTPDWIVSTIRWNTDPLQVLPASIWAR
jgi:hypothetical protein